MDERLTLRLMKGDDKNNPMRLEFVRGQIVLSEDLGSEMGMVFIRMTPERAMTLSEALRSMAMPSIK